jgi:hypothetical protein
MRWGAVLVLLLCLVPAGAQESADRDRFGEALAAMGIDAADLGYRPKAHWARYPHPNTVPHVLPFFPDLLANPLDTYEFTRTLGNAVEDLLTPEKLTEQPDAKDPRESLFKLGVALATDRRIGGFRGYGANLAPAPREDEPLLHALEVLSVRAGRAMVPEGDGDAARAALRKEIESIPEPLRLPLARYVLNLVDARTWIDRGLRDVPESMRREVFATLPDLAESTPDGTRYFPILDDVAKRIDEHSLHYGCLKALQATQDARRAIAAAYTPPGDGWPEFAFRFKTPWGTVRFSSADAGTDDSEDDLLCLVTFGHTGVFWGPVGATTPTRPLSVALLIDHSGNAGQSVARDVQKECARAPIAAGILGCGIFYSAGARNNEYRTGHWGLGAGLFGLGAMVDEGGDDTYKMASCGEGAAYFGAGLLLDAAGDDAYALAEGDSQGFGGPGGIGVLADRSGNDTYYAEPDAVKAGRADYHSKDRVAANMAQGAGGGRRGDLTDGHAWAGGLGALLDVDGDDTYTAGNFTQGIGYWYGTGLLWDGGGGDTYTSVYFTQGSGAHFAVGALIDESGDDRHVLEHNAGAAYGFGWDVVNAFLIDRGAGNDRYEGKIISIGVAEVRSNAFFLDEGGDDTYVLDAGALGFGDVDERDEYTTPKRTAAFGYHLAQVGVFLDLGGKDRYLRRPGDGLEHQPDPDARDGATWHVRRRDPAAHHGPNVSYGADVEGGVLGFLRPWPARVSEATRAAR